MLANTTLHNKIHCSQDVHNICWRKRCSVLCDNAATLTTVTPRRMTGRATRSRQTTVFTHSPVHAFTLTPARASDLRPVIHHRRHHGHGRARTGGGQNEGMLTPTHIASCAHVSFGLKSVSLQTPRHGRRKMPPRLRDPTVMLTDQQGRCCNALVV